MIMQVTDPKYLLAALQVVYNEAAANAAEAQAKANDAWALAGGECEGSTATCRKWAKENRKEAKESRALARKIRENPSMHNFLEPWEKEEDEAMQWRTIADEAQGNIALSLDQADQARLNAETGNDIRLWTRAAEAAEQVASARKKEVETADTLADAWDKKAAERPKGLVKNWKRWWDNLDA